MASVFVATCCVASVQQYRAFLSAALAYEKAASSSIIVFHPLSPPDYDPAACSCCLFTSSAPTCTFPCSQLHMVRSWLLWAFVPQVFFILACRWLATLSVQSVGLAYLVCVGEPKKNCQRACSLPWVRTVVAGAADSATLRCPPALRHQFFCNLLGNVHCASWLETCGLQMASQYLLRNMWFAIWLATFGLQCQARAAHGGGPRREADGEGSGLGWTWRPPQRWAGSHQCRHGKPR